MHVIIKKILRFLHLYLFLILFGLYTLYRVIISWISVLLFQPEKYQIHLIKNLIAISRMAIFLSFCKVKVHNKKNIDNTKEPYIIIANHQSFFDIFACSGFLPIYFVYLAKNSVFSIPLFGGLMKKAGCITVPENKGMLKTVKEMMQLIKERRNILIFPEGKINKNLPKITEFKRGFFQIAAALKVTILPLSIYNTDKILNSKFSLNRKQIELDVLAPITKNSKYHPANKNSPLSFGEKMEYFQNIMQSNYNKLAKL